MLTGFGNVRQRRKTLLDGSADGHHRQYERQTDVADDCPSHQSRALVVALEVSHDVHRRTGRPRDQIKLIPEPVEYDRDVEAENERQRDEVAEVEAVHGHRLERPARCQTISGTSSSGSGFVVTKMLNLAPQNTPKHTSQIPPLAGRGHPLSHPLPRSLRRLNSSAFRHRRPPPTLK